MADPFAYGDDDADTDEHAAAFPRLNHRQRVAEEPQEPPVDPALLAWARNEKQLVEDAARVRGDYVEPTPPRPTIDLNTWAANHKKIIAAHAVDNDREG